MNILVTGGAGYIGSITVELLVNQGYDVVVLDSMDKGHKEAIHPQAKLVVGRVGDKQLVGKIIRDYSIDAVFHFAAESLVGESMENPAKYFNNNVVEGLALIEVAAKHKIKKFVLSSTAATYGEPLSLPITETHPTSPTNPYGESKLILEKALKWFDICHGLKYVALRYFNACGASDRYGEDHTPETHLIPLILEVAMGEREEIKIFGDDYPTSDGTCIRDYIHVIDLAQAHVLALDSQGSNIYNLGNGNGFSVKQVIESVLNVTGKKISCCVVARRQGDPAKLIAGSDKIIKELNWQPKYDSIEKIIETAWKWKLAHPHGYKE